VNSSRPSGREDDLKKLRLEFEEYKGTNETQVREHLNRIRELELIARIRDSFGQFEYKDVVFNGTAGSDTEISHSLDAADPEKVRAIPVMWEFITTPVEPPYIYRSGASNRRPWGPGYIILRCNVANAVVRMLLHTESR
jgi:hypothetical protein